MKNLESFCAFDTENATATVRLFYQSASEIIDEQMSRRGETVATEEAVEQLENCMERIPKEFKVDFLISVADTKEYDTGALQNAYRNAMEIQDYKSQSTGKKKSVTMGVFVLVGSLLLLLVIFNTKYKWFTSAGLPFSALIAYFLELIFEIYFEEGMTHFFITRIYEKAEDEGRFGTIRVIKNCN